LLKKVKNKFAHSKKGRNKEHVSSTPLWCHYTVHFLKKFKSVSLSQTLFGFTVISRRRFYTFMASPKIPWMRFWPCLWKMIPEPLTDGRLIVALNDSINPKTGKKIFGCRRDEFS